MEEKSKSLKEVKLASDAYRKIKDTEDELTSELNRLKISLQAKNLQENSFTLNRSIDHGENFLSSIKKQEYSQFLKSSKVITGDTTNLNNLTQSSLSNNSRSGKF